jgi:hypothetical protein
MSDIINTNTIPKYNLTFGKNIISLYDEDETSPFYRLEIRNDVTDDPIGTLRQPNNIVGYAHFDVKNILQNQITFSDTIETTTQLKGSPEETFRWYGAFGEVLPNGTFDIQGITTSKITIGGRKNFDILDWNVNPYLSSIGQTTVAGTVTAVVNSRAQALTDYSYKVLGSQITDGKPTWAGATANVYIINRLSDEPYTLSFINGTRETTSGSTPSFVKGIAAFRYAIYNGNTLLTSGYIQNTTANGGGPNTTLPQTLDPNYPYDVITLQGGYLLPILSSYPTLTHYYFGAVISQTGVTANDTFYGSTPISDIYRFNVIQGECNDFDPIQVSWVNSFGFRDYFTFQKRKDEVVNVERNIYQKLDAQWAGTEITVDAFNRGESIFSQTYTEEYTIRTRYLKDWEMQYLKNLIMSPNVRVRFSGSSDWVSVIPTTNSWTERTFRKDKFFQLEFGFRLANKLYSQKS